ncbi:hypothetical protein JCM9279_004979 [Rhodotorula babjevae]
MLDRLPYELTRRILDEAHPPLASSSSDSPSTSDSRTRLRFLANVERTCKSVQVAAHDLLWHSVWIQPAFALAKQLDRILDQNRDECSLVRVLNFAHHDKRTTGRKSRVKLASVMQALGKMDNVVEISLRQRVENGTVDFAELLKRQCLRTLIIEGDNLKLLDGPQFLDSLALPMLRHLALEGVNLSSRLSDNLLTRRHFPVLETVSIQRVLVDYASAFPEIELELLQQLESVNVALDEWPLCQPVLGGMAERVLVHLDGRISANIDRGAWPVGAAWSQSSSYLGVKNLVLMTEETVLYDSAPSELLPLTVRAASVLLQGGGVSTLFRPVTLRNDMPTTRAPAGRHAPQRVTQAEQLWRSLRSECYSHKVDIHYLDYVTEFDLWPTWAQGNPSLRRMVAVTQERDLRREKEARRARDGRT